MEWLTTLLQTFAKPFQWWVVVAPWERGLRIRLGKTAADLAPGIHFRIPFLDRVHVQSIRLRTLSNNGWTFASKDGHALTVGLAIDFSISDLREMFNTLAAPDTTLRTHAMAAIGRYVGERDRGSITRTGIDTAVAEGLASFRCGLTGIRARVTCMTWARALRVIMNEYESGSGLYHDFDRDAARNS